MGATSYFSGQGSSPHTRGALGRLLADEDAVGIIPAYAGSTSRLAAPTSAPADHPRIRGEHEEHDHALRVLVGSSPHTRGALYGAEGKRTGNRIIPAYAGSTEANSLDGQTMADHPRIRGEHLRRAAGRRRAGGSSPHTRGARSAPGDAEAQPRIIPAYAGSTPSTSGQIGGDAGSSPHTRGAQS